MVGADVAVAWIDKNTGKGYAEDYYLDAKSQCAGNKGSCPDTRLGVCNIFYIFCFAHTHVQCIECSK